MGMGEGKRRADRDHGGLEIQVLATYEIQGELHVLVIRSRINSFKFTEG